MNISMEALALAGRIIMESGGETYRVEETVTHMGHAFGLQSVETFAVPSGLFIGCRDAEDNQETRILRLRPASTDLSRVDAVNQISRQAEAGQLTAAEALAALQKIAAAPPPFPLPLQILGAGVCALGFTLMFAGGWLEAAASFGAAALVQALSAWLSRLTHQSNVTCIFRSFFTALLPMALFAALGRGQLEPTVGGALMPLLPGLTMTTAVQDLLRGDSVSGGTHLLRAALIAAMVAAGALFAAMTMRLIGGLAP